MSSCKWHFPSSLGGYPCRFCEAGEEAQNSGPRAQWLGYHHRHGPEGEHFHHSRCELKYLCWLAQRGCIFHERVWWKKQQHAIDRSRVESQPGSATEWRVFPPLRPRSEGLLNFLSHQTQPVVKWGFHLPFRPRHDSQQANFSTWWHLQ